MSTPTDHNLQMRIQFDPSQCSWRWEVFYEQTPNEYKSTGHSGHRITVSAASNQALSVITQLTYTPELQLDALVDAAQKQAIANGHPWPLQPAPKNNNK